MPIRNPFVKLSKSFALRRFPIIQTLFASSALAVLIAPAEAAVAPPTSLLSLSLAWNAVPETGIQGYRLYIGTQSHQYTQQFDMGTVLEYPVNELVVGQTYYFAVSAIGGTGLESTLSDELVVTVNPQPVAVADSYSVTTDTPLTIAAQGVLSNDADLDSATITAVLNEGPSHGSVILNANGGFVYTPSAGFTGADSFTYHATDGVYNSEVVTVSLTVKLPSFQLLVNGSFESGYSGWTAAGNQSLESVSPYAPTDGANLVAFNGRDQQPNGVLSQSFPTVEGETYTLDFDAGVLGYNTNSQQLLVTVTGGSNLLSETIITTGTGTGSNRWYSQSLTFVADGATATLAFKDVSQTSSSIDLLLDNVRVTGAKAGDGNAIPTLVGSGTTPSLSGRPGAMKVGMAAAAAGSYVLERSQDLVNWEVVSTLQLTQPGPLEFTDSQLPVPNQGKMFYRIGSE